VRLAPCAGAAAPEPEQALILKSASRQLQLAEMIDNAVFFRLSPG